MSPLQRDLTIRFRATKEEQEMLQRIADAGGLSASDIVRQLIRREYVRLFPDPAHSLAQLIGMPIAPDVRLKVPKVTKKKRS